jgi:hypothetical protein
MEEIGSSDRAAECRAVAEKVIADIEKKLDEKQKGMGIGKSIDER